MAHPHPLPLPSREREGKATASIFFSKSKDFTEGIEISPKSRRGRREATFFSLPRRSPQPRGEPGFENDSLAE
jgi:hypothetical protein